MTYEQIKHNYVSGLWGVAMLKVAYHKGLITLEEYKEIIASK